MDQKSPFQLISFDDFDSLFIKLKTIRSDLSSYKTKKIINVLDYYVIYELCRNDDNIPHISIKYGFDSPLNNIIRYYILPVSYIEMRCNFDKIISNIGRVSIKDINLLKHDDLIRKFKLSFEFYIHNSSSLTSYKNAIKDFREAFLNNPRKKVVYAFKRAIYFLFYNKLFLEPIELLINYLKTELFLKTSNIKNLLNIDEFTYEDDIYRKCFNVLSKSRYRLHADIVDAMCYAICLAIQKRRDDILIRFYTSPAPYDAFFNNNDISKNDPSIVRDYTYMALEKFILENNNSDIDKSILYIDGWLNTIQKLLNQEDRYSKEALIIRNNIRNEFRKTLLDKLKLVKVGTVFPFYYLFGNALSGSIISQNRLYKSWNSDMRGFFEKIDHMDDNILANERRKIEIDIKSIMETFYGFITKHDYLEQEINTTNDRIKSFIKTGVYFEPKDRLDMIKIICDHYFFTNGNDWDQKGLKKIINDGLDDFKEKEFVIKLICLYLKKCALNGKYNFASFLQKELNKKKAVCK